MDYKKLNKKALGCMYVAEILTAIVLEIIIFIVSNVIGNHTVKGQMVDTIAHVLMGLVAISSLIAPIVRYYRYCYLINDSSIEVVEGYFFIQRQIVPIERLHKIETVRGPIDRCFGLTKVNVTTAGGSVTIRFLEEEMADEIANSLKHRINQIVISQKENLMPENQEAQ